MFYQSSCKLINNIMRILFYRLIPWMAVIPFICSCGSETNDDFRLVDEGRKWEIYLSEDETAGEQARLPVVTIWARDKETGKMHEVLPGNPDAMCDALEDSAARTVPVDVIWGIASATILSLPDDPLTLLIEACWDGRSVDTYIYRDGQKTAISLPTNGRCLGLSDEEGLIIMQSYKYYEQGGRYNVISAFDLKGRQLSSMSPMLYPGANNVEDR